MKNSDWKQRYKDRLSTAATAIKAVKSGDRIFIGTGCG